MLLLFISIYLIACAMFLSQVWFGISKYDKDFLEKVVKELKLAKVFVTCRYWWSCSHKPCYGSQ